jgi:CBS domain-containing protein
MAEEPIVLPDTTDLEQAARCMKEHDIGVVIVSSDGAICGVATDRDLVIRGLAEGNPLATLADICTREVVCLPPDARLDEAVFTMRKSAVRRVVVMEGDRAVGLVSLGDLATQRSAADALADIAAAGPTTEGGEDGGDEDADESSA